MLYVQLGRIFDHAESQKNVRYDTSQKCSKTVFSGSLLDQTASPMERIELHLQLHLRVMFVMMNFERTSLVATSVKGKVTYTYKLAADCNTT